MRFINDSLWEITSFALGTSLNYRNQGPRIRPIGSEYKDNELTDITARGAAIAASARLVNAVQVGLCVGVSIVLPAAVWGC